MEKKILDVKAEEFTDEYKKDYKRRLDYLKLIGKNNLNNLVISYIKLDRKEYFEIISNLIKSVETKLNIQLNKREKILLKSMIHDYNIFNTELDMSTILEEEKLSNTTKTYKSHSSRTHYYCLICDIAHRYSSKIGKDHETKQGLGTIN